MLGGFLIFLTANICLASSLPAKVEDDSFNSTLLAVAVLFRHGDRTPLSETWPTDKYYKNSSLYPEGRGQLNNQGKLRHYELGKWFRERYSTFLPATFATSDIYVKSTDYDRTLMSAECNLAGLYPPSNTQLWNPDLLWQPIPIHTTELAADPILSASEPCAKYSALYDYYIALPAIENINTDNAELLANWTELMGTNITSFTSADWIHSQVAIYKSYGLDYPAWVDQYWDDIVAFSAITFQLPTLTRDLARLRQGPFFNYLLSFFDGVIDKTSSTKFLMLSAHDTTVADTLNSMLTYNDRAPEYASTVIWELRQVDGYNISYVNAYFKNSTNFEELYPFDCQFNCHYEDFKSEAETLAVDVATWRSECAETV